jgi:hypothetical protein
LVTLFLVLRRTEHALVFTAFHLITVVNIRTTVSKTLEVEINLQNAEKVYLPKPMMSRRSP